MAGDMPSPQPSRLAWLLARLVNDVPGINAAILLSADGMAKDSHGLRDEDRDRLAATASGLCSLAKGIGNVRQVVVETDDRFLFVSAAGHGSVLAILAGREADPNVVGFEMQRLIKQVQDFLVTPTRLAATGVHIETR
jgi:predicted regulator of Ras-like GTPase activity (Roadblock/LC7/MglB family)